MAPPDVQDAKEQEDPPPAEEEVPSNLVGTGTSRRRRRCYLLIGAVVLCLFIIVSASVLAVTMATQSGFDTSTQQRNSSEPSLSPSVTTAGFDTSTQQRNSSEPSLSPSVTTAGFNASATQHTEATLDPSVTPTGLKISTELSTSEPTIDLSVPLTDCAEIKSTVLESTNGTYLIDPDGRGSFRVYCDMTTDGGGWTVFQRRQDGSEDFSRTWNEYKTGFGNLSGEFWLGNEYIHRLTYNRSKTLRMDMANMVSFLYYQEVYKKFYISNESKSYTFHVGDHIRGRSDSLGWIENSLRFSTKDRDNDGRWGANTADAVGGGWWYRSDRYRESPNGLYRSRFGWYGTGYSGCSITYCEMKVR